MQQLAGTISNRILPSVGLDLPDSPFNPPTSTQRGCAGTPLRVRCAGDAFLAIVIGILAEGRRLLDFAYLQHRLTMGTGLYDQCSVLRLHVLQWQPRRHQAWQPLCDLLDGKAFPRRRTGLRPRKNRGHGILSRFAPDSACSTRVACTSEPKRRKKGKGRGLAAIARAGWPARVATGGGALYL